MTYVAGDFILYLMVLVRNLHRPRPSNAIDGRTNGHSEKAFDAVIGLQIALVLINRERTHIQRPIIQKHVAFQLSSFFP